MREDDDDDDDDLSLFQVHISELYTLTTYCEGFLKIIHFQISTSPLLNWNPSRWAVNTPPNQ